MIRAAVIAVIGSGFWGPAIGQITTVPSAANGMSFQVQSGATAATQNLTLSTTTGPTTLVIGVPASQTWLTVAGNPAGTLFFVNTTSTIPVTVTPTGLGAGQIYSANITIAIVGQPASAIVFPVTLVVSSGVPATPAPSTLVLVVIGMICCWMGSRLRRAV